MKKLFAIILFLSMPLLADGVVFEKPDETISSSLNVDANKNLIVTPVVSSIVTTSAVVCSSTTATLIKAAATTRTGIVITNTSDYSIYLATYAATAITSLYLLKSTATLSDVENPYSGAWYGLGSVGIATTASTLSVIEKKR